jgi:hypothetical protein
MRGVALALLFSLGIPAALAAVDDGWRMADHDARPAAPIR